MRGCGRGESLPYICSGEPGGLQQRGLKRGAGLVGAGLAAAGRGLRAGYGIAAVTYGHAELRGDLGSQPGSAAEQSVQNCSGRRRKKRDNEKGWAAIMAGMGVRPGGGTGGALRAAPGWGGWTRITFSGDGRGCIQCFGAEVAEHCVHSTVVLEEAGADDVVVEHL